MSDLEYDLSNQDSNDSNNDLCNTLNNYNDHNDYSNSNDYSNPNEFNKDSKTKEDESKKIKREINYNATLAAIHERQERLEKIKARIEQKNKNENNRLKLIGGLEMLYNIMKKQNIKFVDKIQSEFNTNLPFNSNLQSTIIKPPYLTPKIVSHHMEKLLNET